MYNIGIIGCGHIAGVMADSINSCPDHRVAAVASRSSARAKKFAAAHCPDAVACGSYDKLTRMDDLDLVYIATPNTYHYECAIKCIKAYKNVLIEKPFAMNADETRSIFTEAKNRNLFVAEAMWTSFMPLHKQIIEWIEQSLIGEVKYVTSNLGYSLEDRPRLTDPQLGGGSYLDLGVYPVNLAVSILGPDIVPVSVYAHKFSNGVERDVHFILERPEDGATAASYVTMSALTDRDGAVVGDKGYIKICNINNYESVELYDDKGELVSRCEREGLNGYALEIIACCDAIANGFIQAPDMPWSKTQTIASIGDRIRGMM